MRAARGAAAWRARSRNWSGPRLGVRHVLLVRLILGAARAARGRYTLWIDADLSNAFTRTHPALVREVMVEAGFGAGLAGAVYALGRSSWAVIAPTVGAARAGVDTSASMPQGGAVSPAAFGATTEGPMQRVARIAEQERDGDGGAVIPAAWAPTSAGTPVPGTRGTASAPFPSGGATRTT